MDKSYAFKWGLARLILDTLADQTIDRVQVLPFFHLGMEKVLPTRIPYIPRSGNKITVFIRPQGAIDFTRSFVRDLCRGCQAASEQRMKIMQYLEREMRILKYNALQKHLEK